MSDPKPAPTKTRTVTDLVMTAAVASLVSAVVSPWVRRWFDSNSEAPSATSVEPPPAPSEIDPFDDRIARLLKMPDPFSVRAASALSHSTRGEEASTHAKTKEARHEG